MMKLDYVHMLYTGLRDLWRSFSTHYNSGDKAGHDMQF